ARRDTVENYLKRLRELEAIANSFKGVEKSYALQAGREIRVFVSPVALYRSIDRKVCDGIEAVECDSVGVCINRCEIVRL
ncbi:MAG: hypothetical protein AAB288_01155, partial [Acidobacteriota bacterium]